LPRVGFIFIPGTVGLLTCGREKQMERGDSIQIMGASSLVVFKMVGVMAKAYA